MDQGDTTIQSTREGKWHYRAYFEISRGQLWLPVSPMAERIETAGSNARVINLWGEEMARRQDSEYWAAVSGPG